MERQTTNSDNSPYFFVKHDYFKNSFFPSAITEWNKLDYYIMNADSFKVFQERTLRFISPLSNNIYNILNPLAVKYLRRLRIGYSHLKNVNVNINVIAQSM